jgi:uncharacterized lipoprotein NlpE involved in copper resistance
MNKRNKKRSVPIVVALLIIILLSAVGCTNKQEYILQYLDANQEMVTEVYTTINSINSKTIELDSLGIKYWVE